MCGWVQPMTAFTHFAPRQPFNRSVLYNTPPAYGYPAGPLLALSQHGTPPLGPAHRRPLTATRPVEIRRSPLAIMSPPAVFLFFFCRFLAFVDSETPPQYLRQGRAPADLGAVWHPLCTSAMCGLAAAGARLTGAARRQCAPRAPLLLTSLLHHERPPDVIYFQCGDAIVLIVWESEHKTGEMGEL
jgi:hypothetical protein